MKNKHSFLYLILFVLKKSTQNTALWFKNLIINIKITKYRLKDRGNNFFTKDGFHYILVKIRFDINYFRYRSIYFIKNLIKNSKKIINTGYLSFTIFLYFFLSILFFFLSYNIWVQSYDTVKVPDFKGAKVLEAIDQIQSLKLIPVFESRYSNLPYGSIISQYPVAGHVIKQNRKIKLIVSKGLEYSFLEDFSGWTLYALEKKAFELSNLLKKEIKVEKIGEEYSDVFDKGLVIAQQPEAGIDLSLLESIKVVVSKGKIPEKFTMPNFVGKSIEDAQKEVESLGLILNIQYKEVENLDEVGIVLSQTPEPNKKVSKGITIILVIGQKKL